MLEFSSQNIMVFTFILWTMNFISQENLHTTISMKMWKSLHIFPRQYLLVCRILISAPDIIHCNDWQTGLIPVFLHTVFGDDNFYAGIKTVFTIHNLQFQGRWRIQEIMDITGLPAHIFNAYELESYGEANYLKGGVVYADYITTVSPTYANEITTVEGGEA